MAVFLKRLLKLILIAVIALIVLVILVVGIIFFLRNRMNLTVHTYSKDTDNATVSEDDKTTIHNVQLESSEGMVSLENGLLAVRFDGDYGFDELLRQGGVEKDSDLVDFLTSFSQAENRDLEIQSEAFGCSTLSAKNQDGGYYFGRNFDWISCNGLIVEAHPDNGYSSISTVNTDFIHMGTSGKSLLMSNEMLTLAALYVPLDGMNEKGLCVSVNMIQSGGTIQQDNGLPDVTTTTAIRLLLDKAASVEEAVELLSQYDLHASFDFMVHFAIADAEGNSVVVEYVNNEMVVTKTPVVTNFFLAEERYGIGTAQSMTRYDMLNELLDENGTMSWIQVRDALDSVSKHNFDDGETTEWSIVFDQNSKTATYFHREDYETAYQMKLE